LAASGKQRGRKKGGGGAFWTENQALLLIDFWKDYRYTLSRAKDGKFMEKTWKEMHQQNVGGWRQEYPDMGESPFDKKKVSCCFWGSPVAPH